MKKAKGPSKASKKIDKVSTRVAPEATVEQPNAPPEPGFSLPLWSRAILALALVWIGYSAIQSQINRMNAELIAQRGQKSYTRPGMLEIAKSQMRQGLRHDPNHVEVRYWFANSMLRTQQRRATASDFRDVDRRELNEVLSLLDGIRGAFYIPFAIYLKSAEAAQILTNHSVIRGDMDDAATYGQIALDNYLAYRRVIVRPMANPSGFYNSAASTAAVGSQLHYALLFTGDFLRYFGFHLDGGWDPETGRPLRNAQILRISNEARRQLGEHHLFLADSGSLLLLEPDNAQALTNLLHGYFELGREDEVYAILSELERAGRIGTQPAEALAAIRELRKKRAFPAATEALSLSVQPDTPE